jgi:hypothetical protein
MRRTPIVLALTTGVLLAVLVAGATVAVADPNVPNIPAHRHFVQTPAGKLVQVGPRLCDDPSLQQAFNQFHINIHSSSTSPTTPVDTLGPQHGAPGLHNTNGAELTIRLC